MSPTGVRGWRRAACRALDLLAPGSGMMVSGRIGLGGVILGVYGAVVPTVAALVCLAGIHPLQAALVGAIVYATLVVLLWFEPVGVRFRPGLALVGLAALVLVVMGGLWAWVGHSCALVVLRDHCEFPGLLPGEAVLVHRGEPARQAVQRGDLVVAQTPGGPILARVVGTGGDRVTLHGVSLTRNDAVVPSSEVGVVLLPEVVSAPPEEVRNLQIYEEELDTGRHPFFFRRGVVVGQRSWEVPEGHVVLVCDNRSTADARDSREVGPLPVEAIIGRPGPIVWSRDPVHGVRLDRIGALWR